MKKIIIISFGIFIMFQSLAQDIKLGVFAAYGNSKQVLHNSSDQLYSGKTTKYGLSIGFSPFLSNFTVLSGIEFEDREYGDYLAIPLGLNISVGQTIRFFAEGGGYYASLLNENNENYILSSDWGMRLGGGITWAFTTRMRTSLSYQRNHGLAPCLSEEKLLPYGQTKITDSYFRADVFKLSLSYRF